MIQCWNILTFVSVSGKVLQSRRHYLVSVDPALLCQAIRRCLNKNQVQVERGRDEEIRGKRLRARGPLLVIK
jgi:hypothetical protein